MTAMHVMVTIAATVWLLSVAQSVLQPLAIAGLLWFLFSATTRFYRGLLPQDWRGAAGLARTASAATFLVGIVALGAMVSDNVQELRRNLPTYEANIDSALAAVSRTLGLEQPPYIAEMIRSIDLTSLAVGLAGSAAGFLAALIVIIFYMLFIMIETRSFRIKLAATVPEDGRRGRLAETVRAAGNAVEGYLGVQAAIGVLQAVPTFVVLALVGVDAPVFWAVLIFVFSFIPTIGTLVGILFPSLMALLQFESLTPFLIVAPTLALVQLFCSNWLQPKMMGKSLNLSPLAVFIAIFAGGALWGIVGVLMAVPVLSVAMIASAQIPGYRAVAIALSREGDVPEPPSERRA